MSKTIEVFQSSESMGIRQDDVQQAYARCVEEVIARVREHGHGQAFLEAETGVGKTLGYLIPLLLDVIEHGERAIVSTHSIHLQNQIALPSGDMELALDTVERMTGRRPTFAVRLGMTNFVDKPLAKTLVKDALASNSMDREDRAEWESFRDWLEKTTDGEIREYLETAGVERLPSSCLPQDFCLAPSSRSDESRAFYQKHVDAANAADVVITNHATLIWNSLLGGRLLSEDAGRFGAIVVDECDKLPDAARSMLSKVFSLVGVANALKRIQEKHEIDQGARTLIEGVQDEVAFLGRYLEKLYPGEDARFDAVLFADEAPQGAWTVLQETLHCILAGLRNVDAQYVDPDDRLEAEVFAGTIRNLSDILDDEVEGLMALCWSPTRHYASVRKFSLYPARILKRMWRQYDEAKGDRGAALILTSATISAPSKSGAPNFQEMKVEYGVYENSDGNPCADLHDSFSPKKFGAASFVFPDPSAPPVFLPRNDAAEDPDMEEDDGMEPNPEWVDYCSRMILAAQAHGGRVLALMNSYQITKMVCDRLRMSNVSPVEKTPSVKMADCIKRIRLDDDTIFVSPSAWEGLDLRKQGIQFEHVVIAQLPYARPDGVREKALTRKFRKANRSEAEIRKTLYSQNRSAALRRFRQGFGRGIRDTQDKMTLWIADRRFPLPGNFAKDPMIASCEGRVHPEFGWAIPKRFRVGAMGADTEKGRVFLRNGTVYKPTRR